MRLVDVYIFSLVIGGNILAADLPSSPSASDYARYALSHSGRPDRGRAIFNDETKASCVKCHTVDGSGGKAGPDLSAVATKFPKPDLIRAIEEPSSSIAVGYATTAIMTTAGDEFAGIVKSSSSESIELMLGDGSRMQIKNKEIASQRVSPVSLMPEGLWQAVSPEEFSDLLAYLLTLSPVANGTAAPHGFVTSVPRAAAEAVFTPFLPEQIRFRNPTWFGELPNKTNIFLTLEGGGKVWLVERNGTAIYQKVMADLSGSVLFSGGSGLLACAFHPRFQETRKFYLKFQIRENGKVSTLVVERQFTSDFLSDSGLSRTILDIPCATQDHTGGGLEFGSDGMLYIGMGDSGPQRDPQGHGQDLSLLLGKILRIDVDHKLEESEYAIPSDNPFVGQSGVRPEIWAYGFREPWRITFDRETQDFWVGDVGQDRIEEVDLVRAGENHGWNVYEGFDRYSDAFRRTSEFQPPVFAYPHSMGVSITGGYVYRGAHASKMRGWYICADFEARRVWALTQRNRSLDRIVELGLAPSRVVSFAQLQNGELLLVGYDSGRVYQIDLSSVDPAPLQKHILAQTSELSGVFWRMTLTQPSADWYSRDFDDQGWTNTLGGFGTAGTPGAVIGTDWRTENIWLRREFPLPESFKEDESRQLLLRLHHDEDVEIFLNGVEILRRPRWTSGYIDLPLSKEAAAALRPGRNVLAVHCRQKTGGQYIDAGLLEYLRPESEQRNKPIRP